MSAAESMFLASEAVNLGILSLAGVIAGIINAIAGGGGFLALPILLGLGLPAASANATMRVGVLLQNVGSLGGFHRHGLSNARLSLIVGIPTMIGAFIGAEIAVFLPSEQLEPLFGGALLAWGLILLIRPGRFLHPPQDARPFGALAFVFATLVGIYGGFMQAGVGLPLLALLVLYLGHDAVRSNAVKVTVVLAYTIAILPRFAMNDLIVWREGLILGAGMMLGGWLGARWQIRAGAKLVRWFVILMVGLSGAAMIYRALA
jgi:uncharacterized membrane protein YfcA